MIICISRQFYTEFASLLVGHFFYILLSPNICVSYHSELYRRHRLLYLSDLFPDYSTFLALEIDSKNPHTKSDYDKNIMLCRLHPNYP